jgi:allantoinase
VTYDSTAPYPRDLAGYGRNPPHAQLAGQARIAVQFVLNYEEGGENSVLHGDPAPSSSCPRCSTRPPSPSGT